MKLSRIFAVFILLACIALQGFGQMKPIGEARADSFPHVSFKINHRDPAEKSAGDFQLEEGGKQVKFSLDASSPNDSGQTKSILILWEYLPAAARDAQNKFFREVILKALPELLQDGDEVNVATFAWTDQKKGAETISLLNGSFSNDTAELGRAVRAAKAPGGKGIDAAHGSELFPAISEGIEFLATTKAQAKMLIVLSAEFPNVFNPGGDVAMVTGKAMKADVAVYNLRYKIMAEKYNLDDVAHNTYGQSFEVDKANVKTAVGSMLQFSDEGIQRSLGTDYVFEFKTETALDGKTHALQLQSGTESLSLQYEAPSQGIGGWIQANLVLFIVIIVLLLAAIAGAIFWMRHRNQQEILRRAEEQRKLEAVESSNRENESKLQQQKSALERIQREEQNRLQQAADAKRKAEAELEAQALLKEMYANGRQPRLTTIVNGHPLTMELPSPVTTVGRDATCDVQISDQTISRTHFQVIYQGGKYMMLDLGSTNGTLLNGARTSQAELRHGDQIIAGEAILFFYI